MGKARGYDALPTFWSDQYDLRIQSAGITRGDCDVLVRGDMERESFSIFYLQNGAVVALDAVNNPKDFMRARSLIQERSGFRLIFWRTRAPLSARSSSNCSIDIVCCHGAISLVNVAADLDNALQF